MKSVLLAYLKENKLMISRSLDILDGKLINFGSSSDYSFLPSVSLPAALYKSKKPNDLFAVEWDVQDSDDGRVDTYVVNSSLSEKIYEVIDIDGCVSMEDVLETIREGIEFPLEVNDEFFICTGRKTGSEREVIYCEKKYFSHLNNILKLKDTYNNKPIIALKKYLVPFKDIISLQDRNSEYTRELYAYTDLSKLGNGNDVLINDGKELIVNYFYQVIKNRRSDIDLTKKEAQSFVQALKGILYEDNNSLKYLVDLGYSPEYAENLLQDVETAIEAHILKNDENSEFITDVVLSSQTISDKYYPEIEEKFKKENESLLNEINDKNKELEDLKNEIAVLNKKKEEIADDIKSVKQFKIDFEKDFETKIKEYVSTNEYLKSILGGTNQINSSSLSLKTANLKPGEHIERKKCEKEHLKSVLINNAINYLGLSQSSSIFILDCIFDVLSKNNSFIIENSNADVFAGFLSSFIGINKYDTLYIDTKTTISELSNIMSNEKKVVLVKNALRLIDLSIVNFLIENYTNILFVFSVDDVSCLKYYPSYIWNKIFYMYYDFRKTSRDILDVKEGYESEIFNEDYKTSSNEDKASEGLNLSFDDDEYLGIYKDDIRRNINSSHLVRDNKFNYFYACQLVLLLNSYGLNVKELSIDDEPNLQEYILKVVNE